MTEHHGKRHEETSTGFVTAAAGIILGRRGCGARVAVLRGAACARSDVEAALMLHHRR
ncbi:hypothetical protein ABZX40_07075 [Streptomyces sp. NPDC004610]|uniref:hypothetical protein n=1 Tax=unclassified Streptomyces TaxID=2593676 RepID=UPI0033BCD4F4